MNGQRVCPQCNAPADTDARFCGACGATLVAPPSATPTRYCSQCGAAVSDGARFCRSCGAGLERTAAETRPETPVAARPVPPAAPGASQAARSSRGCFTGWRKAAIITLIALVLVCPPTGVALYFYGTSLDDDDAPISLADLAAIDFAASASGGQAATRVDIEPHPDIPITSIEILSDPALGSNAWMHVSIQPTDDAGAIDLAVDSRGLPTELILFDNTRLSMEYLPDDVIVQFLYPNGEFGAAILPIEAELRELIDAASGAQARTLAPSSPARTVDPETGGGMLAARALDVSNSTGFAFVGGVESGSADEIVVTGHTYVSVEARSDENPGTPITGIEVVFNCVAGPCHHGGTLWPAGTSSATRASIARTQVEGRRLIDPRETQRWQDFTDAEGAFTELDFRAPMSVSQAVQDSTSSNQELFDLIRRCEDAEQWRDDTLNRVGIAINSIGVMLGVIIGSGGGPAGALAGGATGAAVGKVAADVFVFIIADLLPYLIGEVDRPPCSEIVRGILARNQMIDQFRQPLFGVSTMDVCVSHPHYVFAEPCQRIGPFNPFEFGGPAPLGSDRWNLFLGPSQPFNLVFAGTHRDYSCGEHFTPIVIDRLVLPEGSIKRNVAARESPFSQPVMRRLAVDADDVVLEFAPEGYYEQCIIPADVAEATPTSQATATRQQQQLAWVLVDTQVNPRDANLEEIVEGPRWVGSYDRWSVSDTHMSAQHYRVDGGTVVVDVTTDFSFDSPPDRLTPGATIQLSATGSMSASKMCVSAHEQFQYELNDVQIPESYFALTMGNCACNSAGEQCGIQTLDGATTTVITAPDASPGAEFTIGAGLWNCSACNIVWTYRAE